MSAPRFKVKQHVPGLVAACLLLWGGSVAAQSAGEVEFSRGVGFAQSPGQVPRVLGKGLPLREGDRLTTAEGASAIIRLADGTRMTVRPNSEIVLRQYQFRESATEGNSMLMDLLRGGLRAITGGISKSSPNAARIQTNTATIGIRGTDFDVRVCGQDCGAESARVQERGRPNQVQASARLAGVQGEVSAVDGAGARRRLVDGGSVYPGEVVETGANTRAVVAFRDDTRVTLGASTRFRVDNFVFDEKNPGEGRFLASVLRGTMRALTGLIGKANTRNVGFATATATVGIRGTGLDIVCTGACAGEPPVGNESGLTLFTWLGSIVVSQQGQTALQVLQAGQGLFISPTGMTPLSVPPPQIDIQRPDQVTVPANLFTTQNVPDNAEGVFVFVRDGHIEVTTSRETLQLGRNETGFANFNGLTARPLEIPKHIEFDRIVLPNTRNPALVSVLSDAGIRQSNVCR